MFMSPHVPYGGRNIMVVSMEQSIYAASQAKLYGDLSLKLAQLVHKVIGIFPSLEAVQPRKSGMQALCGLHLAIDKTKSLIQYCTDSSKLYLAITGDSVLVKFEKVKDGLDWSLRHLEQIVPLDLAEQIATIVNEVKQTTFVLGVLEQEVHAELISLLQRERESHKLNALSELDMFDRVALKLGIASGKAFLTEKKALRKLLEKARSEEDRKKELLVAYLLRILRRYGKIQKYAALDDAAVVGWTGSCPSSPSEEGSTSSRESESRSCESCYFEVCEKKARSHSKRTLGRQGHVTLPPEEFRCPISLQLMADPVIISSGQTYERVSIEKWFEEGHDTCPKSQQKLAHLNITPNYCVKGLIASWCERHGVPIPEPPSPLSLVTDCRCGLISNSGSTKCCDDHLQRVASSESAIVCANNKPSEEVEVLDVDCNSNVESLPLKPEESSSLSDGNSDSDLRVDLQGNDEFKGGLEKLLADMKLPSLDVQCRAAEQIHFLAKDNAEVRSYIGDSGFIPALVEFLHSAISAAELQAQETATLCLLNVAIDNNRNKAEIVATGAITPLVKLLDSEVLISTKEAAVSILCMISYLDESIPSITSSGAVSYLVGHLDSGSDHSVEEALTTLCNLSIFSGNCVYMIPAGIVPKFVLFLSLTDAELREKCIAALCNLASFEEGRTEIVETENSLTVLAEILETGTPKEREHAVAIFLLLSTNSFEYSQLVLREGIIPSLVMLSVNGNVRGKDKAQKLLYHFREQRQKHCMWQESLSGDENVVSPGKGAGSGGVLRKTRFGPTFSFFRRSKPLAVNQW